MNKILPIILVVVLSESVFSSEREYLCSVEGKDNYDIHLKITNNEIIIEGRHKNGRRYSDRYKINTETSTYIIASTFMDVLGKKVKLSIEFDKRLLRTYHTTGNDSSTMRPSHECREQ